MRKIEKILVPVDFSECASAASEHAAFWANQFRAELHFLHVWRVPWYLNANALTILSVLASKKAGAKMAHFLWSIERVSDQPLRSAVTSGTPRNVILERAQLHDYDLIVIGTHGRTGLEQLFLGSTAEGVVRRAPCPVLTIRRELSWSATSSDPEAEHTDRPADDEGYIRLNRILVPVDFSECSTAALEHAVKLSREFGASIDVLNVVEPSCCGTPLVPPSMLRSALAESATKLAGMLKPLQDGTVALESRAVLGYPPDAILSAIETKKYDVVVLGTHGRRGPSPLLLGSVAEQIVRRAPCPVLTVRSPHNGP